MILQEYLQIGATTYCIKSQAVAHTCMQICLEVGAASFFFKWYKEVPAYEWINLGAIELPACHISAFTVICKRWDY